MVQLKKSTLNRRKTRLRGQSQSSVTPTEWATLAAVALGCTALLYFLVGSGLGSSSSNAASSSAGGVRSNVGHGRGRRVPELSDSYNAIANDVIRALECKEPVKDDYPAYNPGDGGGAFSGDVPMDDIMNDGAGGGAGAGGAAAGGGGGNGNGNGGGAGGGGGQFLDDDARVPDALNNEGQGGMGGGGGGWRNRRRRLQIVDDDTPQDNMMGGGGENRNDDAGFGGGGGGVLDDFGGGGGDFGGGQGGSEDFGGDFGGGGGGGGMEWGVKPKVNAKHLLCLAAGASDLPPEATKDAFKCDVLGTKREALLDLWESARGQQIGIDVIRKSLDHAMEHSHVLLGHDVDLWSPWDDDGLTYELNELNVGKDWNHGGVKGLDNALGPHKLFVDVGSALGLTSMAVSLMYPGTAVVAIEPAAPSWLMQELNLRCNNLHPQPHIRSVLAGVGPKNDGMAKMMWRPSATTSTRTWTPKSEHRDDDIELTVHLRNIRTILAEGMPDDLPYNTPISVLNVDCEGCEYDVFPSMTDADFDSIDIILGEVHWGYISDEKLPSSDRARKTHERLCKHEAIARNAIECCAFPDMTVETQFDTASTVRELSGTLCDKFDDWAKEHHLFEIDNDIGWFELSSMSDY